MCHQEKLRTYLWNIIVDWAVPCGKSSYMATYGWGSRGTTSVRAFPGICVIRRPMWCSALTLGNALYWMTPWALLHISSVYLVNYLCARYSNLQDCCFILGPECKLPIRYCWKCYLFYKCERLSKRKEVASSLVSQRHPLGNGFRRVQLEPLIDMSRFFLCFALCMFRLFSSWAPASSFCFTCLPVGCLVRCKVTLIIFWFLLPLKLFSALDPVFVSCHISFAHLGKFWCNTSRLTEKSCG